MRLLALILCAILSASAHAIVIGPGGRFVDIALGSDGLPVIAYSNFAGGTGGLQVAKCANADCSVFVTRPVDNQSVNAWYVSLAVGGDGLPAISYFDAGGNFLRFVKCGDAACSTGNVARTIDGGGGVNRGQHNSIAVTANNRPAISYFDASAFRLRYAICSDAVCTSATTQQLPTQNQNLGEYTSMVMGPGDVPQFTYQNATNLGINLFRCSDGPACTSGIGNFFVQANACSGTGAYNSLALGQDGLPVVSYYNTCLGALTVAKCTDAFCGGTNLITTVDGTGTAPFVGRHTSIAIGTNGNPLVSYYDETNQAVKLLRCGTPVCVADNVATPIAVVGNDGGFGRITALVVNTNGNPLIAFHDLVADELEVLEIRPDLMFGDSFED